ASSFLALKFFFLELNFLFIARFYFFRAAYFVILCFIRLTACISRCALRAVFNFFQFTTADIFMIENISFTFKCINFVLFTRFVKCNCNTAVLSSADTAYSVCKEFYLLWNIVINDMGRTVKIKSS